MKPNNSLGGNAPVGARFIGRIFTVNRPMNRAPTINEQSDALSGLK